LVLTRQLKFVDTYLDNLIVFSRSDFSDHLEKLTMVLTKLHDVGLRVNAAKSKNAAIECEYLGYVLTREGIKPQPEKVVVILMLEPSKSVKQLRRFLGVIHYYRDLWK